MAKQGGKPKEKTLYEHPVGGARPVDDEDIVEVTGRTPVIGTPVL